MAFLTPEQLDAINSAATDEQQKELEERLAKAYALRNQAQQHHTTGLGAALGGLGDMLNTNTGMKQEEVGHAMQNAYNSDNQAARSVLQNKQAELAQRDADLNEQLIQARIAALRGGGKQAPAQWRNGAVDPAPIPAPDSGQMPDPIMAMLYGKGG